MLSYQIPVDSYLGLLVIAPPFPQELIGLNSYCSIAFAWKDSSSPAPCAALESCWDPMLRSLFAVLMRCIAKDEIVRKLVDGCV